MKPPPHPNLLPRRHPPSGRRHANGPQREARPQPAASHPRRRVRLHAECPSRARCSTSRSKWTRSSSSASRWSALGWRRPRPPSTPTRCLPSASSSRGCSRMPTLADHHAGQVIKLLNVGSSGAGKTGALASLALAGYHLYILDYDGGPGHPRQLADDHPDALARVTYAALRDEVVFQNGIPRVKPPIHAYADAGKQLAEWNAWDFTPRDVIVLDTLIFIQRSRFLLRPPNRGPPQC